jgi:hypothetical protein
VDPDAPLFGKKWDAVSNLLQTEGRELLYNAEANRLDRIRDVASPQTVHHTYVYDAVGFVTSRDGVAFGYSAGTFRSRCATSSAAALLSAPWAEKSTDWAH